MPKKPQLTAVERTRIEHALAGWEANTIYYLACERGRKKDKNKKALAITVTRIPNDANLWVAIAIESAGDSPGAVLDEHAHHVVAEKVGMYEAIVKSNAYAKAWAKGETSSSNCECDEIEPKRSIRRARKR